MNNKIVIEVDKYDLINFILGFDVDLYDSRFVNSLPKNLQRYGMWSSAGWDKWWHWCIWKLDEASFEEVIEIYNLVKKLK